MAAVCGNAQIIIAIQPAHELRDHAIHFVDIDDADKLNCVLSLLFSLKDDG